MIPLYTAKDKKRVLPVHTHQGLAHEPYRSPWRRDYARLIHSPAFRRLQGKTQVFYGLESDFFRNRLTHSLEVAQIAESIAVRLNAKERFFKTNKIDTDLIRTAALAHDLGHPPFGHNGEKALDFCMRESGGFEGNAQTLRILAKLEKRELPPRASEYLTGLGSTGKDLRTGLNLTYRTLASILKYDRKIDVRRPETDKVVKGYYASEVTLVSQIQQHVLNGQSTSANFKTIECGIMDIADDIAYSIYDLEDAFKAGFTSPLEMLSTDSEVLKRVSNEVKKREQLSNFSEKDVVRVLTSIFKSTFEGPLLTKQPISIAAHYFKLSDRCASDGYLRTAVTSRLVTEFIQGVEVTIERACPVLSKVYLRKDVLEKVEVLKHFTYQALIMSPMMKVAEHRGYDIVKTIFETITSNKGSVLLPDDFKGVYMALSDHIDKRRVVSDFIAGMTDRYAIEFYGRLSSENAQTIFKPL